MDPAELNRLIQLMNDNGLVELEVEEKGKKIRLRKAEDKGSREIQYIPTMTSAAIMGSDTQQIILGNAGAGVDSEAAKSSGLHEIRSPMVGTFYRSASPDSDPFVEVGAEVHADTVVCILEAMKVMNEIKAEVNGVIREILVQNGAPIEFDQPIFRVQIRE